MRWMTENNACLKVMRAKGTWPLGSEWPGNVRLFNYSHQFPQYLVAFTRKSFQFLGNIKKL